MNYKEITEHIKNLSVHEKAYILNLDKIEESHYYSEYVSYAETRGKAKSDLLEQMCGDGILDNGLTFGEEISYLNIPIMRDKYLDKYLFNGESLTRGEIVHNNRLINREEKLQKILDDESVTHCYIKKRGGYYRPNSCGYTGFKSRAGVYAKELAIGDGRGAKELSIIPIINADHNEMINQEIAELKMKLLPTTPKGE